MAPFRSEKSYDRRRLLDRAARAARGRSRRKRRKAVALYRRVLTAEPDNPDLLRKLAPLLAQTDEAADACASYRRAASQFVERGFVDRAVGVYRDAVRALPHEASMWEEMAALELQRGRSADAVAALLDGRRGFRKRRQREDALALLWAARKIDPEHYALNMDLASLLARCGAGVRGVAILEGLIRAHPDREARVRARHFCIAPSPGAAWRWMRSALNQRGAPRTGTRGRSSG